MKRLLDDLLLQPALKHRLIIVASFLIASHLAIAAALFCFSPYHPTLIALALLAYGLGLRHAVDPDHIAAIDNTTRKLMQEGQKPVGVGLFFAIGHSTMVLAMCVFVAFSASALNGLPPVQEFMKLLGTGASCFFLLGIGAINLIILINTLKTWMEYTRGETTLSVETDLDAQMRAAGPLSFILRPALKMVGSSASMFWVGLLFGLGFDTASEVTLLTISGSSGASGMPLNVLLLVPMAFAAGMSLIDTLDGVLMLGAYGWAFMHPARKLYYNLTITFASVLIAIFIGGIEALQIVARVTQSQGWLWKVVDSLQLDSLGYYTIALFLITWMSSMLVYKWRAYDRL
jgi:high-affinity nickel-transport protein